MHAKTHGWLKPQMHTSKVDARPSMLVTLTDHANNR
jgi:hypothetical protein